MSTTDQALVDALAEDLDAGEWRKAWKRARRLADTCDRAGVLRRDLAVRDLLVAIAGLAAALDEAGVELEEGPDELDEAIDALDELDDDDDDDAEGL